VHFLNQKKLPFDMVIIDNLQHAIKKIAMEQKKCLKPYDIIALYHALKDSCDLKKVS
jgi:hypothetical protein